jgi:hypothetical protein
MSKLLSILAALIVLATLGVKAYDAHHPVTTGVILIQKPERSQKATVDVPSSPPPSPPSPVPPSVPPPSRAPRATPARSAAEREIYPSRESIATVVEDLQRIARGEWADKFSAGPEKEAGR